MGHLDKRNFKSSMVQKARRGEEEKNVEFIKRNSIVNQLAFIWLLIQARQ